ncbi:hypothetical protein SAY86_030517 [Trapa natans]|uniref:Uncharacterized protein n=1 Tax=Trapa natans TaxID=22666 RepID=A0AAN7M327_TRANT|nr:hypothetical protein SAY86_030517 [Trapa natans]
MEGLMEAVEKGSSDQHSDALIGVKVNELKNNFEKCQQLMVSIAESISSKAMKAIQEKDPANMKYAFRNQHN